MKKLIIILMAFFCFGFTFDGLDDGSGLPAERIPVNSEGFYGLLSPLDTTVQKALKTIDSIIIPEPDLSVYVQKATTLTINGVAQDLSASRTWTIDSMIYPDTGIAVSTGTAWGSSITDNSTDWNTAYGWGNHASAGYLTTESDPKMGVTTEGQIAKLNNGILADSAIYENGGNVGIGTASPKGQLDVDGNIYGDAFVNPTSVSKAIWTASQASVSSEAYGYWKFEGNLTDERSHYTLGSSGTITYPTGRDGQSISIANGGYLTNAPSTPYNGDWSFSVWVKRPSVSGYFYSQRPNNCSINRVRLGSGGAVSFEVRSSSCSFYSSTTVSGASIGTDWTHFVWTSQGGSFNFYVNGTKYGPYDESGIAWNAGTARFSGDALEGGAGTFDADDLMFFSGKILSQSEVNAIYATGAVTDLTITNASGTTAIFDSSNNIKFTTSLIGTSTTNIGWSKQSAANQACNTTCTKACVFGQNTADFSIVDCADATADVCICAGSS